MSTILKYLRYIFSLSSHGLHNYILTKKKICKYCHLKIKLSRILFVIFMCFFGFVLYKSPLTRLKPLNVSGYKSLQQQELVNPALECSEIVIWWKAFISEEVPKGCHEREKAWLIKLSPAHRGRCICSSASNSDTFERYGIHKIRDTIPIVILVEQAEASNILPVWQGLQISRMSRAYWADYPFLHSI